MAPALAKQECEATDYYCQVEQAYIAKGMDAATAAAQTVQKIKTSLASLPDPQRDAALQNVLARLK